MNGIEKSYCDACINALVGAWRELKEATGTEVLRTLPHYGKSDTLGLDAIPEITIADRLGEFDKHAILITEESDDQARRRWPSDSDPLKQPLMFFCDPTDRSVQLQKFFERIAKKDPTAKIGALMQESEPRQVWEEMFEAPVEITGPTTAITCVRKGEVVFSVIVGYVSDVVYVMADTGIFQYPLKKFTDPANEDIRSIDVIRNGKKLVFPSCRELKYSPDDCKRFTAFLGKEGYKENFEESKLFADGFMGYVHHQEPPGPPRPLYLSELQNKHGPMGFVLANGEKIGEWMHWLSFVKFAKNEIGNRALRAFEVSLERPRIKNDMLMSTSPAYSIFCRHGETPYIDISRLRHFDRPSQFRCMLVVARADNERIIHSLYQRKAREVTDFF